MILVRNVFQLQFGKAKEAMEMMSDGRAIMKSAGYSNVRFCSDVTGRFYTFVLELTFDNLSAFESSRSEMGKVAGWQAWYDSFSQLVESGHREIYTIVE